MTYPSGQMGNQGHPLDALKLLASPLECTEMVQASLTLLSPAAKLRGPQPSLTKPCVLASLQLQASGSGGPPAPPPAWQKKVVALATRAWTPLPIIILYFSILNSEFAVKSSFVTSPC